MIKTNSFFQNNIVLALIVIVLGVAAHCSMLPAEFKTLDDSYSIVDNVQIKDIANAGELFKSSFFGGNSYYRPLVSLSFMIEHHFFSLQSFYYNLTNLGIHLATAVTVFFLLLMIVQNRAAAFCAALLFATHPIQWEPIANIPGRAVLLSTFFSISAFFFYCLSRGKKRQLVLYGLSLLFFACGLLSKESAAMLPILLLSYIFLLEKDKKQCVYVLPYFGIIALYLAVRQSLGITVIYPWRSPQEHLLGICSFLRGCLTYLRLFIWPVDLHFDRAREMFLTFRDWELWATVLTYCLAGILLLRSKVLSSRVVLFFLSWFCIELFPVSQIVTTIGVQPGYISLGEHFLYMPAIGIFVLIVFGVQKLYYWNQKEKFLSPRIIQITSSGMFLFFLLITVRQGYEAQSALTMLNRTLHYNPNNARILFSMGLEMTEREQYLEGEQYFRRALENDPSHMLSRLALGRALHDQGKYIEAMAVYETITGTGEWDELLAKNLQASYQKAITQYQQWIAASPRNAQLYYSLGTVYSRSQRLQEGIEQYKKAIAIDPVYKNALFNLASSYGAIGDDGWAVAYYERVVSIEGAKDELDRMAYTRLGEIYRQQGDLLKAQGYVEKAALIGGNRKE